MILNYFKKKWSYNFLRKDQKLMKNLMVPLYLKEDTSSITTILNNRQFKNNNKRIKNRKYNQKILKIRNKIKTIYCKIKKYLNKLIKLMKIEKKFKI